MAGNANSGGRNKKPTHLHVLQGTFRQHRHAGHDTPNPPQGRPAPPKSLKGEARAEWDRIIESLEHTKALTIVDHHVLYQYVQLFAETEEILKDNARLRKLSDGLYRCASKKLSGYELVDATSKIVELQQIIARQTTQLRQGHMALRMYLVEFGLTPSARTRVKLPKGSKPAMDPNKARFLNA